MGKLSKPPSSFGGYNLKAVALFFLGLANGASLCKFGKANWRYSLIGYQCFVHPRRIHYLFTVKGLIMPFATFGLFGWCMAHGTGA